MKRVLINYSKLRKAQLLAFGRSVYLRLSGNEFFPEPDPSLLSFKEALDEYEQAMADAENGGRIAVGRQNALQVVVYNMLRFLAIYVNGVSKGNLEMLISSGLKLAKTPEPVHIYAPVIKELLQGLNAGSIVVKIGTIKGASFMYQCKADAPEQTEWISLPSRRSSFEFTGLNQGKKYWFRVVAVGSKGQLVYGDEVAQYVMQRTMTEAV